MKSFFKYLLCNIVFFSSVLNAQTPQKYSGLFWHKSNIASNQNLKDSVKSVHNKFNEPKQSLSVAQKSNVIMDNDVRSSDNYYDEFQRHKSRAYGVVPDQEYKSYDPEKSDNYEYNDKDWLEKSKYKTALKQYYPVFNLNLLVKLNQIEVPKKEDAFGEDGKVWQDYSEYIYIYIYI